MTDLNDDEKKKKKRQAKAKEQALSLNFKLEKSAETPTHDFAGDDHLAKEETHRLLKEIRDSEHFLEKILNGVNSEADIPFGINFADGQMPKKQSDKSIKMILAGAALFGAGRLTGLNFLGYGGLAATATGVGKLTHGMWTNQNLRLVRKDFEGAENSERDIVFTYDCTRFKVPITPKNLTVIREAYDAAADHFSQVRGQVMLGKKTPQQLAEELRNGISRYIIHYASDVKQESVATKTEITGGTEANPAEQPESGVKQGKKKAKRGMSAE